MVTVLKIEFYYQDKYIDIKVITFMKYKARQCEWVQEALKDLVGIFQAFRTSYGLYFQ